MVSGKSRRGRPASKVCLEDLVSFFDWPNVKVSQPEAAKTLGISLTTLKQICRRLGFPRWPYKRPLGWANSRCGKERGATLKRKHQERAGACASPTPTRTPPARPFAGLNHEVTSAFSAYRGGFVAPQAQAGAAGAQDLRGLLSALTREDLGSSGAALAALRGTIPQDDGRLDALARDHLTLSYLTGARGIAGLDLLQLALVPLSTAVAEDLNPAASSLFPEVSGPVPGETLDSLPVTPRA